MNPDFEKGLKFVLAAEGGYVNDSRDPGGATNMGITQSEYDPWRSAAGHQRRSVRCITPDEVRDIYLKRYWVKVDADEMPTPLNIVLFDTAVNMGVSRAITLLQDVLGEKQNGMSSPILATFANAYDGTAADLCEKYLAVRLAAYHDIVTHRPKSEVFLHGWINRIVNLRRFIAAI